MSSENRIQKHLYDVLDAIKAIESFTEGVTEVQYLENQLLQAAVERKFEVIGEALNRLDRDDDTVLEQITDYQRIIGFRNILAHGYDAIDQRLVWDAVRSHLQVLKRDVVGVMESSPSS
jgi:uncharacterized protein with HEPN domain